MAKVECVLEMGERLQLTSWALSSMPFKPSCGLKCWAEFSFSPTQHLPKVLLFQLPLTK